MCVFSSSIYCSQNLRFSPLRLTSVSPELQQSHFSAAAVAVDRKLILRNGCQLGDVLPEGLQNQTGLGKRHIRRRSGVHGRWTSTITYRKAGTGSNILAKVAPIRKNSCFKTARTQQRKNGPYNNHAIPCARASLLARNSCGRFYLRQWPGSCRRAKLITTSSWQQRQQQ